MSYIQACDLEKHADKYAQYPILSGGNPEGGDCPESRLQPEPPADDEPFGALDVNTRSRMQEMLMTIWERLWHIKHRDRRSFSVTHDIPEACNLGTDIYIMASPNPGENSHPIGNRPPF